MRMLSAIAVLFLIATHTQIASANKGELESAEAVVASYKELRKYCSITRGDERRACFRELNQANDSYQTAKSILARDSEHSATNLHLVTSIQ